MFIVLTYHTDGSGTPEIHCVRSMDQMARLWLAEAGSGRTVRIFAVPQQGEMREITLPADTPESDDFVPAFTQGPAVYGFPKRPPAEPA